MSDPFQSVPSLREPPSDAPGDPLAPDAATAAAATSEKTQLPDSTPKDKETSPPIDWKVLVDRALHFLSTASNETLGACLVGLGAGTYLILGRVGLILIGVVGGVALHATWESHARGHIGGETSQEARRRELGVDIAHRVLEWRDKKVQDGGKDEDDADPTVKLYSGQELDFSDFRPETAAALTELTDAVIRDYVKWWYNPIIPTETLFPNSCRQTLTAFLISMSTHLSRKRPADTFVDFVTKSSSFMIIFFSELSNAILAAPGDTASEAVDLYLKMKRDSTLATILDSEFQTKQLAGVAEDILQNYLEPKTYNCKPAREFLHQILGKVVLEMIVTTCSKPEWINGMGEPELMNAIDAGVEASPLVDTKDSKENIEEVKKHKRVVSRAQQAMDDAMQEAQRLNQMIAEEDAKKLKEHQTPSNSSLVDDQSESTTQGIVTPTSSQSETLVEGDMSAFGITNITNQTASESRTPSPTKKSEELPKEAFTSFDQLVPNAPPTALMDNPPPAPPPLTLHNCKMTIFDDAMPGEKGIIRNKPIVEYLIQIEPSLQYYKGWMSAKKYADFETLHEVLRRIAPITGASGFVEAHKDLPTWKNHTKASLRGELERYLNDAVQYKPLAESEGMKRFLDKDIGSGKSPGAGGMIDVLTKAPKEVAGGGKALFGGVTGVLGSVATPFGAKTGRESMDLSPVLGGDQILNLPPMPSEISDDYSDPYHSRHPSRASTTSLPIAPDPVPPLPRRPSAISLTSSNPPSQTTVPTTASSEAKHKAQPRPRAAHAPLSEYETTVLIELFFATINELYTLSSAWTLRRTLLNAAKTFLLRPGNPQLTSIQTLLQDTALDANTSDAGLAYHIRKVRVNALPTEEELRAWPKEMSAEEKETLRKRARKALVERGMPAALTSVMGGRG
ncbi:hypothetical protein N0V90_002118 [Kalmusia sp. IMI 367209]|nr:hypothetical protein N0V90_002118 [Kalmusia sp. IMI 367209]